MPSLVSATFRLARRLLAPLALACMIVRPGAASAQVVDFESLSYGPACSWSGGPFLSLYQGMYWSGIRPLDLNNFRGPAGCNRATNTGYAQLDGNYVGQVVGLGSGAAALASANPFVLTSLVAGAGWIDPTKLTLEYYLGGVLQNASTLNLLTNETGALDWTINGGSRNVLYGGAADLILFLPDYSNGADTFNSAGESCLGVPAPCVEESYKSFYLDNLTFRSVAPTTVPEPGTMVLLGVGLLGIAGWARRRR